MKLRITALILLAGAASYALARNVIREWGGHVLHSDYQIDSDPQYGDYGVVIRSNPHPEVPWRFEAYKDDDPNQPPGDIDYIEIADGVTVGDIHLSVIGDLSHVPPHLHGAAQLKAFDLSTNGTSTNKLEELDITGDFGELGVLSAPSAGALTIV